MKAPNGPLILALSCAAVFAISWIAITASTTPGRAVSCGIALCLFSGTFIWFAETNRFAVARALISSGATALAAPLAAIETMTNEGLIALLADQDHIADNLLSLDVLLTTGWRNVAIGAGIAFVLIIAGGIVHRTPRDRSGDGAR